MELKDEFTWLSKFCKVYTLQIFEKFMRNANYEKTTHEFQNVLH